MSFGLSKDNSISRRGCGSRSKERPKPESLVFSDITENNSLRSSTFNSMSFRKIDDHFEASQPKPLSTGAATERVSRRSRDKLSVDRSRSLSSRNDSLNVTLNPDLLEKVDKAGHELESSQANLPRNDVLRKREKQRK
jgi:hypothetical protein